jgi:plastocyanin
MTPARHRSFPPAGLLLPTIAVLALALTACSGGGGGAANAASPVPTATVDLPKSYRFAPTAITVRAGATVTWTNHDNFSHNVSLDGQGPLVMSPGQSVTYTFATAGTFAYVCSFHPKDMKGSVLVTGS